MELPSDKNTFCWRLNKVKYKMSRFSSKDHTFFQDDSQNYSFLKCLEEIKLNPEQHQAYFDLAELLLSYGNLKAAFRSCKKGIEYAGYCPNIINNWANRMIKLGSYKDAELLLRMAMCQDTQNPKICYDLSKALELQGDSLEAISIKSIGDCMASFDMPTSS